MWVVIAVAAVVAAGGAPSASQAPEQGALSAPDPGPVRPDAAGRLVDGVPVPPFGHSLERIDGKFVSTDEFMAAHLAAWPGPLNAPTAQLPLAIGRWTGGPYANDAGRRWVEQINAWYSEGTAAGLHQDTFRSYDNNHSSLGKNAFPQLRFEEPVAAFNRLADTVFLPRVTMGVQSYGIKGSSVIEAHSRAMLRRYATPGSHVLPIQKAYKLFYEHNFLFIAPAVGTFKNGEDAFAFLSPFYVHSVGASGTDAKLLKPFVFASAALPPALKTRILRQGLYVPILHYLFKSHIAGDLLSPDAHLPAYALPPEAADSDTSSQFLDGMIYAAHRLTHIPPVCRIRTTKVTVDADEESRYDASAYFEDNTYAITAALRKGQTLILDIDLRFSWTDTHEAIASYHTAVLRGGADIAKLQPDGSQVRITIPWAITNNRTDLRTDILLLVHDGDYFSAPAYISVRHLHPLDPIVLGIRKQPVR